MKPRSKKKAAPRKRARQDPANTKYSTVPTPEAWASPMDYLHRVLDQAPMGVPLVWFRAYGTDDRGKPCSLRLKAQNATEAARLAPHRAFKGFTFSHVELDPDPV